MPLINRITAWSYSRYSQYKKCPFAAKCAIIDRIKEPGNSAMDRGNLIHKMAEVFTSGKVADIPRELAAHTKQITAAAKRLPAELEKFAWPMKELRADKAVAEGQWTFDKLWQPTSWFGPQAWCRIKVDAHKFYEESSDLLIVDHKTGREHDDHADQRSLYALGGFLTYPAALVIKAAHWYLDSGVPREEIFHREQLPILQKKWEANVRPMLNDERFAPRVGNHCRWCYFSKNGGNHGPCQY